MSTDSQERRSPRLLDQVRELIRIRHYSIRTEQAYVQWIRRFILFDDKRHPLELGAGEVICSNRHSTISSAYGLCMRTTFAKAMDASICHSRWHKSIRRRKGTGAGNMCSRQRVARSIRVPASNGVIMHRKTPCSVLFARRCREPASSSRLPSTRCGIRSPLICSNQVMTSARSRSSWAMQM
jgi:hypothetical protein